MKLRRSLVASISVVALSVGAGAIAWQGMNAQARSVPNVGEAATPPGGVYHTRIPPADRHAYFGELHLHTVMSLDAWTFGTKVTPDQAYRFARGEQIMVPAVQVAVEQGIQATGDVPAQRAWPLDFTAVTDHSEFLGAIHQLDTPTSAFAASPLGKKLLAAGRAGFAMVEIAAHDPQYQPDLRAAAAASDGWNVEMRAANANYIPGKFTTFVAYEWTASPGQGIHMHRNVIFNSDHAPTPFTAIDSNKPEDLWKYLDSVRAQGIDVLAIPHNSDLSDGHDFDWNMSNGQPMDAAYAAERALNEPLAEIDQTKGTSDTTPQLSPDDEFANFEIMDRIYRGETTPNQHGSYLREALGRGLVVQSRLGVNPMKLGFVGGSDIHNGLTVSDESGYASGISGLDPRTMLPTGAAARAVLDMTPDGQPAVRASGQRENDRLQFGSPGITGVWAEENTRNSIFAALKRKETFATSGTRIRLRMFGGWDFSPALLRRTDWVAQAYALGVPMGGDLPSEPAAARAPTFVLQAMKDPDGANLDRIQIIKLWLEDGTYKEKVFDVALSGGRHDDAGGHAPAVGNTVDLKTGTVANTIGAAMLTTVWRDPEFDPKKPAVYYARALEIPTARWSTLLAIRDKLPIPTGHVATIQERAWTSPIWFTPPKA
ncbi:MAG TPA: DUF3604 domain-containing protein [Caulobacteraceae bacterium]|nr:DUF3604 domain-containing protein [Caulobacteraceae bacterium]